MPPLTRSDPPVLRYLGGKHAIADWIIEKFPPHLRYVELFAGGASVALRKQPAQMTVINDLDGEVVNFFRVLREQPDALIRAIDLTPYSRAEYLLSYEPVDEPLEKARRFYTRLWQSHGQGAKSSGWSAHKNESNHFASDPSEWSRLEHLYRAASTLKGFYIEQDDALNIFKRYDQPNTLFYADPPYKHATRADIKGTQYTHEMSDEQHVTLLNEFAKAKGYVLLSGYRDSLYDYHLRDWQRFDRDVMTNGKSRATESLWVSPNACALNTLPLFASLPKADAP